LKINKNLKFMEQTYNYENDFSIPIRSSTLRNAIIDLDDTIMELEFRLEKALKEKEEWKEKYWKEIDERLKEGNSMMAQTLNAIIGVPGKEGISPVMATTLVKLKQMKTIEEVHNHINEISKKIIEEDETKSE